MQNEFLKVDIEQGVAVVTLDRQGHSVNTLSTGALDAIESTLDELSVDRDVRAVVLVSGKASGFVAGADVEELKSFDRPEQAYLLSRRAHAMIRGVRAQHKPIVAAIHGAALGGGLELALACDFRVAAHDSGTRLGLPEVKLGLLPGGGGTQLLPRLVGIQQALGMMLTGKNVYPRPAKKMGLVDALTHAAGLRGAGIAAARDLADKARSVDRSGPSIAEKALESNPLTRRIVYQKARDRVKAETRGNYPAPLHIVDAVRVGIEEGLDAGFEAEARSFSELVFSDVSRELVYLFFAQRDAQRNPYAGMERPLRSMAVLGGGLMGGGIAAISAESGLSVALKDVSLEMASSARQVTYRYASKKEAKRAISRFERDQIVERVLPISSYAALSHVDLVIEAVPENVDIKREVIGETEKNVRTDCVIASNTSSIPISQIAEGSQRPENVIGMHYFSPVPQVPLMEVVRTDRNPDEVVATAFDAGLRQGKTVIVVNDGPGFYTTRILAIYMNEALRLLEDGGDIRTIDEAMKDFGFPMGPFTLFDLVGIDVGAKITEVLSESFLERHLVVSDRAARLVKAGIKGQKTGAGFYTYAEGASPEKPEKKSTNERVYVYFGGSERSEMSKDAIQKRLSLVMVSEAIRCLEEGILNTAKDGDVGAVFGLGFPPFLGGPFRYADKLSAERLAEMLNELAHRRGPQFEPPAMLKSLAASGGRFHD